MKKSLLAVAAMTAFAGAAQAQSSVTVYGILDVGYVGGNQKATADNETLKQNANSFGSSAQSTSRLGFKGQEDLGGGLAALFTVETEVSPNTAAVAFAKNRQAFVGLSKKGLGLAAVGTQYTPIHTAVGATDPGQQNNVVGSVIYPSSTGLTGSPSDGNTDAYTVRASNMLKVQSDSFAGFKGTAFYVMNNSNTTQTATTTGGTTNVTGWGLGVDYNWKKLLVTANFQNFKNETTSSAAAFSITSAGALVNTNASDNQMYVAATYDFGILKAYVNYVNRKATSNLDSNVYIKRSAQQIGVRSFITTKVEAWASGGTGRFTASGENPTANFNAWQLGSNYWLSKRTNLYAIYGQELTSNTNVGGLNSNYGASNYAVGVRHTF